MSDITDQLTRQRSHRTPATRGVRGDELSKPHRLVHLFRDSYAGSQGRQWLQPHVMWWMFTFLREEGVQADLDLFTTPEIVGRAATMALPPGHLRVEPANHTELNFRLWWSIMTDIAHVVYVPESGCNLLPDAAELEHRAHRFGLRPWMSSSTFEELSGISRALTIISTHEHAQLAGTDEIMLHVLLPELLVAEMHWLYATSGRPRTDGRPARDVVLLRRCAQARARSAVGRYLDPLDQLYLHADELLEQLTHRPEPNLATREIMSLYAELRRAENYGAETQLRCPILAADP
ncbi:hypothetical protein ACQPZ2_24485 [Nocardia pseudovaccinii]|uniref:hypothetical protein n=1 Tax=Nocardia pseudovaccinii TaxID=189540 RepID=UPI003D8E436E